MTEPQPGDIGVVPSTGFVPWAIRTVTRAPVAHAFLFVGGGHVIEGDPRGVRWNDTSSYPGAQWLTNLSRDLTGVQRVKIVGYAINHIGTPYSWIDDAEIGFTDLFGWAPEWMRARLGDDRTLMCSQMCAAAYADAGSPIFNDGRPAGAISPGDLWRANKAAA